MAPFLAFINNIIELQVDKYKVMLFKWRPFPDGTTSIGIWQSFLSFAGYLTIVFTWGVICFTDHTFGQYDDGGLIYFLILTLSTLTIKVLLELIIPDIPHRQWKVRKRHKNIIYKTFRRSKTIIDSWTIHERHRVVLGIHDEFDGMSENVTLPDEHFEKTSVPKSRYEY